MSPLFMRSAAAAICEYQTIRGGLRAPESKISLHLPQSTPPGHVPKYAPGNHATDDHAANAEATAPMLMRWLKKTAAQAEKLPAAAEEQTACEFPFAGGHVLKPATLESLKRMRRSGSAAKVVELVQSYRNGAPARVAVMKHALYTGNAEGLRLAARAMQWTSLNIGASDLSERCASLAQAVEDRGINPQCDHWSLQWIESLLGRVLVALDAELLDKAA